MHRLSIGLPQACHRHTIRSPSAYAQAMSRSTVALCRGIPLPTIGLPWPYHRSTVDRCTGQ
eukprot:5192329-Pyramimonas_sp.AAC.1